MYCPNCGKEYRASDAFCSECGNPLQNGGQNQVSAEKTAPGKQKKKYGILFGMMAAAVALFIAIVGARTHNMEYSNNSGRKLPVVVNQISYQESAWTGFMDVTFEIENRTKTDYRAVCMAILAWDSEGYPIRITGMFELDPDYVTYIRLENIAPEKTDDYSFSFETADIAYMSVFLSYYEDFKGNEWSSPIIETVEKNQGQKLKETKLHYFTFKHTYED